MGSGPGYLRGSLAEWVSYPSRSQMSVGGTGSGRLKLGGRGWGGGEGQSSFSGCWQGASIGVAGPARWQQGWCWVYGVPGSPGIASQGRELAWQGQPSLPRCPGVRGRRRAGHPRFPANCPVCRQPLRAPPNPPVRSPRSAQLPDCRLLELPAWGDASAFPGAMLPAGRCRGRPLSTVLCPSPSARPGTCPTAA